MFKQIQSSYNQVIRFIVRYLFGGTGSFRYQFTGAITGLLVYFMYMRHFGQGVNNPGEFELILQIGYTLFGMVVLVDSLRFSLQLKCRKFNPSPGLEESEKEIFREYLMYGGLIHIGYYINAIQMTYLVAALHVPMLAGIALISNANKHPIDPGNTHDQINPPLKGGFFFGTN